MDFFRNFFESNDIVFIVSQIIGISGAAFLLLSYQQSTHRKIVTTQIFSGLLFSVQYFMIGAYTGMAANLVGMTRSIVFSFRGKSKIADSVVCPIVFAALSVAVGIITYVDLSSLLPMAAMAIATFVLWIPKAQKLRALTLPTSFMWLVYNIICRSYSGILTEVFGELSVIIGLFRFREKRQD